MPADLREKIEDAAREAKRSLNAEIVARLEDSVFEAPTSVELLPASKAKELSARARRNLSETLREVLLEDLNEAVMRGLSSTTVELVGYNLDSMTSGEREEIFGGIEQELTDSGYKLSWAGDVIVISF
jgi:hypothetical protein